MRDDKRGIILYPVLDTLVDSMIARMATLAVLRGQQVRVRSTRLGSIGPNTIYWGSKKWRVIILVMAIIYSALSLAGEFGFGTTHVDVAKRGSFYKRTSVENKSLADLRNLDVSRHAPVVAGGYLTCIAQTPKVTLRNTPYPNAFARGDRKERLEWCRYARSLTATSKGYKKFLPGNFSRHCHELHGERGGDYQLVFNGTFATRAMLARRKAGNSWQLGCEAGIPREYHVTGFATGGFSLEGNFHFLKFDLFGMKPKFALAVHRIPVASMVMRLIVGGEYVRGARYFSHRGLACVELRKEKRLLCLVDEKKKATDGVSLNLTDWYVTKGKISGGGIHEARHVEYEIRPAGLLMHLNITRHGAFQKSADAYRKMLALYDIMQLPGVLDMYSVKNARYVKNTKYTQESALNIAKVIMFRMTAAKVHARGVGEAVENAFEKIASREAATMNAWAFLFYLIPTLTVSVLLFVNIVLACRIRRRMKEMHVSVDANAVDNCRLLSVALPKIATLPKTNVVKMDTRSTLPSCEEDVENAAFHRSQIQAVSPDKLCIGLVNRGSWSQIGFVWQIPSNDANVAKQRKP